MKMLAVLAPAAMLQPTTYPSSLAYQTPMTQTACLTLDDGGNSLHLNMPLEKDLFFGAIVDPGIPEPFLNFRVYEGRIPL